jgi:purine-binding chemotaxis protein CheW
MEKQRFVTFYLDGLYFGVEVEKVQEVLRYQQITHVPLAPLLIRGLINLRGQIVTAIDMRRRLDLSERPEELVPMNLVVRAGGGAVSLLVDEIGEVVEVEEGTFEPPPESLDAKSRAMIRGIHKLSDRLMHVLDAEQTVKFAA